MPDFNSRSDFFATFLNPLEPERRLIPQEATASLEAERKKLRERLNLRGGAEELRRALEDKDKELKTTKDELDELGEVFDEVQGRKLSQLLKRRRSQRQVSK